MSPPCAAFALRTGAEMERGVHRCGYIDITCGLSNRPPCRRIYMSGAETG